MSRTRDIDVERARALMMAALDAEITDDERRELDDALAGSDALRAEWERLARVKEVTRTMAMRKPPEEVWEGYWASVYRRVERGVGWVLVSAGATVLVGWSVWRAALAWLHDTQSPPLVKFGIAAFAAGAVVLIVSVVRERWFVWKKDPYKEIRR